MSSINNSCQYRILVTGSRGKSSVVRLAHAALNASALPCYARITGVIPRELGPDYERRIFRSAPPHIEEARWWLNSLPHSAKGVVLENSAVSPDLQSLAAQWMRPRLTVLTNTVPDHQESWGPSTADAVRTLLRGIPKRGEVVISKEASEHRHLMEGLTRRGCLVTVAENRAGAGANRAIPFHIHNINLVLTVVDRLGLCEETALQGMRCLKRDLFDFHVIQKENALLAVAFSANDPTSTQALFDSLRWKEEETTLLYNHRSDRPERLRSFATWMERPGWREIVIIGDAPRLTLRRARRLNIKEEIDLIQLFRSRKKIFGCGNVAGAPLNYALY